MKFLTCFIHNTTNCTPQAHRKIRCTDILSEYVLFDVIRLTFYFSLFIHLLFSTASVSHWVSPSASVSRTCPSWGDLCTKNCVIASSHCDICVKTAQSVRKTIHLSKKPKRLHNEDISSSLTFIFILYNLFSWFRTWGQHLDWEIWGNPRLTAWLALVTYCLNGTFCFGFCICSVHKDESNCALMQVTIHVCSFVFNKSSYENNDLGNHQNT